MMKDIIAPVPIEAIMDELTRDKFFRKTNNAGNEIYIITAQDSPNIMREIGRLREISFRDSGGGTGLDCDIDVFDIRNDNFFYQLIVWNPNDRAIVGGYRFLLCDHLPVDANGQVDTPTSATLSLFISKGVTPISFTTWPVCARIWASR